MIMSVSTLIIFIGAATPSSLMNLSIVLFPNPPAGAGLAETGEPRKPYAVLRPLGRPASIGGPFDVFHVLIRHAEVMADLVHQHMRDDRAERLVMLRPVIEDRTPVEPDHVRHVCRRAFGAKWQPDTLKQAEDVELALQAHGVEGVVGGKIVDPDHQVSAQRAECLR